VIIPALAGLALPGGAHVNLLSVVAPQHGTPLPVSGLTEVAPGDGGPETDPMARPAIGFVPASIVFGLVHIGPVRRFWPWTIMAVAMGFVFGGLFELTGNLAGPLAAHFLINYENLHYITSHDPEAPGDGSFSSGGAK